MEILDHISPSSERLPKLYSLRGITIATALGSCFAGAFLLSRNFKQLNRKEDARRALLFGSVGCLILVFLILAIEVPTRLEHLSRFVFEGLQVGAVHLYARRVFISAQQDHKIKGGPFFSNWRAAGIAVPLIVVPLSLMLLGIQVFPNAPGTRPDDEFLWTVFSHDTPDGKDRGSITWPRLQIEASRYPWISELREANKSDGFQPAITLYNLRLDKFLTIVIVGTPENHAFQCEWGKIGADDDSSVLVCSTLDAALDLNHKFLDRRTSEIDSIFAAVGTPYRDVLKLQQSQVPSK